MQLRERDAVEFESPQAHRDGLDQITSAVDILGFGRALAGDTSLLAMTKPEGHGRSASQINRSAISGPYASAVSVSVTPSSTARRKTRPAPSESAGSPQGNFADKAHGPIAKSMDRGLAPDCETAAGCGCGVLASSEKMLTVTSAVTQRRLAVTVRGTRRSLVSYTQRRMQGARR